MSEPLPTPKLPFKVLPKLSKRADVSSEPITSPLPTPSVTPVQSPSLDNLSVASTQSKRSESLLKNTIRICEEEKVVQQEDKMETITAVCELLPREECELTIVPNKDEVINTVVNYVIACDDVEFGLNHYMKPLKEGDKSVIIMVKNATEYKRNIQIVCNVAFV